MIQYFHPSLSPNFHVLWAGKTDRMNCFQEVMKFVLPCYEGLWSTDLLLIQDQCWQ